MIALEDVLTQMEEKNARGYFKPFSVEFITYDEARDKGGELVQMRRATFLQVNSSFTRKIKTKKYLNTIKRNPRHWLNATRNFKAVGQKSLVKVHIGLITKFNEQEVVWNIHG